jgi:hypothetical protein
VIPLSKSMDQSHTLDARETNAARDFGYNTTYKHRKDSLMRIDDIKDRRNSFRNDFGTNDV